MTKTPVHTPEDFEGMRKAGKLASQTLTFIGAHVREGITTEDLNTLCHDFIVAGGGWPAPLEQGFPKAVCISINEEVCHGVPGPRVLAKGDSINIDVSVNVEGWYGDTCRMFSVPPLLPRVQHLVDTAKEALDRAIAAVRPGVRLGDLGSIIAQTAHGQGFSVVRDFCGHGIGRHLHQAPEVLHYGRAGTGMVLEVGHFFTIEPMINMGTHEIKILKDGWTAVTKDKKFSAQFEHTLGVTATGCEIFTL